MIKNVDFFKIMFGRTLYLPCEFGFAFLSSMHRKSIRQEFQLKKVLFEQDQAHEILGRVDSVLRRNIIFNSKLYQLLFKCDMVPLLVPSSRWSLWENSAGFLGNESECTWKRKKKHYNLRFFMQFENKKWFYRKNFLRQSGAVLVDGLLCIKIDHRYSGTRLHLELIFQLLTSQSIVKCWKFTKYLMF